MYKNVHDRTDCIIRSVSDVKYDNKILIASVGKRVGQEYLQRKNTAFDRIQYI